MYVVVIYILFCTFIAIGVLYFIINLFHNFFSDHKHRQELTIPRDNIRYEGSSSNNSESTQRTFTDINANNITSELEEPLPLYIPPANPNQRDVNWQSYELEAIRVQQEEYDDGRIVRPPIYRR